MNWTLRDFLNDFCSVYVDDILIFSEGSLEDYKEKIKLVLGKLGKASLFLDINKYEFSIKRTKYLGFILDVNTSIEIDPEKVKAIVE